MLFRTIDKCILSEITVKKKKKKKLVPILPDYNVLDYFVAYVQKHYYFCD